MDDPLEAEIQEIQAMTPTQRTCSGRRVKNPDRLITTMLSQTKSFLGENVAPYTEIGRQRIRQYVLDDMFLHDLDWTCLNNLSTISTHRIFSMMVEMHQTMDYEEHTFEEWNPMILSTVANAQDNPSLKQAMNGPNKEGYWTTCEAETQTLERKESWVGNIINLYLFKRVLIV